MAYDPQRVDGILAREAAGQLNDQEVAALEGLRMHGRLPLPTVTTSTQPTTQPGPLPPAPAPQHMPPDAPQPPLMMPGPGGLPVVAPSLAGVQDFSATHPVDSTRMVIQGAGALAGALPGVLSFNPPGVAVGALTGASLAGTGYDVLTGDPNASRNVAVGVGTALLSAHPMFQALSLGRKVLMAGTAAAGIGGVWDTAVGQPITPGGVATDAAGGMIGQMGSEVMQSLDARRAASQVSKGIRPLAAQREMAQFAQDEGIQMPVSGITNSRSAAKIEQYPQRKLFGSQMGMDYHLQSLDQAEGAIVRRLDRIGALAANRSKTALGEDMITVHIPKLKQEFMTAARQAYSAEAQMIQQPVMPRNLAKAARDILAEGERGVVGFDHTTMATLERIAGFQSATGEIRSLPWVDARQAMGELHHVSFGGNSIIRDLPDTVVPRLATALKLDMTDVLEQQHPDVQFLSRTVDEGYGLMRKLVTQRLNTVFNAQDAETVLPKLIKPGMVARTRDLQQMLDRPTWEKVTSSWLADRYAAAGGTGQPGVRPSTEAIPKFRPARFAKEMVPYLQPDGKGLTQIDYMFDPDTAGWIKSTVKLGEGFKQAGALAAKAEGVSGGALIADAQGRGIAQGVRQMVTSPLAMSGMPAFASMASGQSMQTTGIAGLVGGLVGGAAKITTELGLPAAANALAFTRPGQALMTRAINGADPTALSRQLFLNSIAQTGAQGQVQR